jgi:chromosome partitioning protein
VSRTNNPDTPTFKPEDQEQNRDINALFSSFRLDQASYRTFSRHRNSRPSEQPEPLEVPAQHQARTQIAVFSPMGGSGKSMLVSSLAGVFWQLGKRVLLVDASPWPTLAFHYGANSSRPGIRSFFAPGATDLPVRILACDPNEPAVPEINGYLGEAPVDYVLFDLSGVSANEFIQYLQVCQFLLVPLLPEPSAVRSAEAMMGLLANVPNPPQRVTYIINQMEDSPLAQNTASSLSQLLGDQLFHKPIYQQQEIQEASAEGIVLPMYAPKAQVVSVCNELARWIELPKPTVSPRTPMRWSER